MVEAQTHILNVYDPKNSVDLRRSKRIPNSNRDVKIVLVLIGLWDSEGRS